MFQFQYGSFVGGAFFSNSYVLKHMLVPYPSVDIQDVDRLGIGRVMELALGALGVSEKADDGTGAPLHLSFDIDSIDPKV